jgi:voltage-dependent calcium channel T type alpha-1G
LDKLDYILSFIFLFELLIKVVVYGFAFNGPDSYMKNSWNVMDFIIVFFSMVSIAFADIDLGPIKILRVLRVLRPLRMISRNPGMKIAIQSLINAIPDIGNVMVVSLLFILLFAILGTNFYKGKFYYCHADNIPEPYASSITNKYDCFDYGGDWMNQDQNFDNIG